jgi:hypothetical protein
MHSDDGDVTRVVNITDNGDSRHAPKLPWCPLQSSRLQS